MIFTLGLLNYQKVDYFYIFIDEQKNEDESHLNNKERGGELVINYIKNNF